MRRTVTAGVAVLVVAIIIFLSGCGSWEWEDKIVREKQELASAGFSATYVESGLSGSWNLWEVPVGNCDLFLTYNNSTKSWELRETTYGRPLATITNPTPGWAEQNAPASC